jgi:D-alanyl-D-alanine carboxypeptidase/D-alanyl-D-alanine-endopeptidase (penicillin-binding protein 4)
VNFKALTFHFAPRTDGRGVRIWSVPELPNLTITNALRLEDGPCQGVLQSFDMQVPEPVAADHVVFDGRYQRTCGEQTLPRTALQPATYAYGLFKTLWAQWGGTIAGGVRRAAQASRRAPLLTWYSPPLADLIRPLNKWSNNVMADALLYALADTGYTPPLHAAQGADVIRRYLAEHDIPDAGLVLDNGSGLSRQTRVSARTMLSLLRHAYRSRYMSEYVSSLSIAGVDGTMRRRFRRAPERGWMHLKTGHLSNVAAVAGYVQAQSGRTYVAVLLLNGPTGAGTPLIEALLSWIYRL